MFKKSLLKITLFSTIAFTSFNKSHACSVMSASDQNKTITGYTMEWVGDITSKDEGLSKYNGGGVFLLPAGQSKKAVLTNQNGAQWISKYNSIVFSVLGPAMGFNGINEKGLEVYALGTANLVRDLKNGPTISELDSVSYVLDLAQNTTEAIAVLNQVKVVQQLFPYQLFIKDASGLVAIVDYLGNQRVHYPKPGRAFVTNGWYDAEQYKLDHDLKSSPDNRYYNIGKNLNSPEAINDILFRVGSDFNTMWQTLIEYSTDNSPQLKTYINPYGGIGGKTKKNFTYDLKELFSVMSKSNKEIKYVLFSDFLREQSPAFKTLTSEEDRKIQEANFREIYNNQRQLLYRNEQRNVYIQNYFYGIYDGVKVAPITNRKD